MKNINPIDSKIDEIKDFYYNHKYSACKISKLFNVSHTNILDCMERFGLRRRNRYAFSRKYSMNESYFEKIDTKEKAYWLGFLYADGYNQCYKKRQTTIKLKYEDGYILEKFKKAINTEQPIKYTNDKYNQCYLRINSKILSKDLEKLGMHQAKSLTLLFPSDKQVPDHLLSHFMRGYFDGDGCVTMSHNNPSHCQINICLTKEFGLDLNKLLNKLNIVGSIYKTPNNKIHHLAFGGRKKVLSFLKWIYNDCEDLFLTRKHDKYLLIMSFKPRKNGKSKFFGVYLNKKSGNYIAYLTHNKQKYHLGTFKEEKDAAKARDKKVLELKLDNCLNFPEN